MTAFPSLGLDSVFDDLETARRDGTLAGRVCEQGVRYQRSAAHPGLLERIDRDGSRAVGRFLDGEFVPSVKRGAHPVGSGRCP